MKTYSARSKYMKCFLAAFVTPILMLEIQCWDFIFERFEMSRNGTNKINCEFRHHRYNRTVYVGSGNVTIAADMIAEVEKYMVTVQAHYSSMGNNQFELMPYALKMDGCTFLNGPYRKYAMPSIKPPATDLPYTDDHKVDICEMFKQNGGKTYRGKNVVLDHSRFPYFIKTGLYKVVITTTYAPTNSLDSTLVATLRIF